MTTPPQQWMLSQRARAAAPSPTLAITAKANALKSEGKDIISFGAGEPDFDTPQNIKDAAVAALNAGQTKYTPSSGTPALKDAIIAKLHPRQRPHLRAQPRSSSPAARSTPSTTSCRRCSTPATRSSSPTPYWVSYPEQVKLAGGCPRAWCRATPGRSSQSASGHREGRLRRGPEAGHHQLALEPDWGRLPAPGAARHLRPVRRARPVSDVRRDLREDSVPGPASSSRLRSFSDASRNG